MVIPSAVPPMPSSADFAQQCPTSMDFYTLVELHGLTGITHYRLGQSERDADERNWDDSLARHGYGLTAIRYPLGGHVALTF